VSPRRGPRGWLGLPGAPEAGQSSDWPVRSPYPDRDTPGPGENLPQTAGPVPDRLTIWPVDDGRYGLDATFQGVSGYERAEVHRRALVAEDVPHTFRQELTGGWTLRFGPLTATDIARALGAFVR
jgi:hypothetical protein